MEEYKLSRFEKGILEGVTVLYLAIGGVLVGGTVEYNLISVPIIFGLIWFTGLLYLRRSIVKIFKEALEKE